ncbi:hypothetical protein L1987_13166 [Smallanthus sonchifolius]|uniref:Uncharacterized protein n=1 Tax=Smallanthus sonchifolius TaxID=185202 RepID=A0ACB9JFQ1_9ASTR|nr:hypothetical protein L1987_13166 [Smallanthus sonchifolius]
MVQFDAFDDLFASYMHLNPSSCQDYIFDVSLVYDTKASSSTVPTQTVVVASTTEVSISSDALVEESSYKSPVDPFFSTATSSNLISSSSSYTNQGTSTAHVSPVHIQTIETSSFAPHQISGS